MVLVNALRLPLEVQKFLYNSQIVLFPSVNLGLSLERHEYENSILLLHLTRRQLRRKLLHRLAFASVVDCTTPIAVASFFSVLELTTRSSSHAQRRRCRQKDILFVHLKMRFDTHVFVSRKRTHSSNTTCSVAIAMTFLVLEERLVQLSCNLTSISFSICCPLVDTTFKLRTVRIPFEFSILLGKRSTRISLEIWNARVCSPRSHEEFLLGWSRDVLAVRVKVP